MKISHFSVKHPAIIAMILIALLVFAGFSFQSLNMEFISNINLPSVFVGTIYPGAGAEDVEKDVTNILEKDFVTLPGYKSMDSVSQNSFSLVTIKFKDGIDPHEQVDEIRYRVSQLKKDLPENILGDPMVLVGGAEMLPIISLSIDGGDDVASTTKYIEDVVKPKFSQIPGVSEVKIQGGKDLEVNVKLDINKLSSRKVNIIDVYKSLKAGSVSLPIGQAFYKGHSLDVRYSGQFDSVDDIKELPVGFDEKSKTIIYLRDVADVSITYPKPDYYVDGLDKQMLVISVAKRTDGNIIDITNKVKEIANQTTKDTNNAIKFHIMRDDSKATKIAISTVTNSGILGIIMAILVIALFLGDIRSTLIVGLSIPLSILFTFIGIKVSGMSINLLTVSGLVVALGMIVDGSIVMIEQVFQFYYKRDRSLNDCIFDGADQVGGSIFASVLTTVVVFIPILFLKGIVGSILHDAALTIILALVASFLVAVVVTPFLMKQFLREKAPVKRKRLFDKAFEKVTNGYKKALNWSMKTYRFVIIVVVSALVVVLLMVKALGFTFIPSADTGEFYVTLEYPQGYSLDENREKSIEALKYIYSTTPEVVIASVLSGCEDAMSLAHPPTKAYIHVIVGDKDKRERGVHQIMQNIQKILSEKLIDVKVNTKNGGIDELLDFVSGGGGYALTLQGPDSKVLYETAVNIKNVLDKNESVVSTTIDTNYDSSTLVMDIDHRYLSSLGLNSYETGITSLILFKGMKSGKYKDNKNDNTYDVYVEGNVTDSSVGQETLSKMNTFNSNGEAISFASFADFETEKAISRVNHTDRANTVTIRSTLVSDDASSAMNSINAYLKEHPFSHDVSSRPAGMILLITEALPPILKALAIAWFLVYFVMVIQFEKFRQPLIIMISIPFCLIGVILGLIAFGSTANIISVFGLISLGGIVVNNAIILIDNYNMRRNKGDYSNIEELHTAVTEGSASRLRPILMTTLSTMFGVLPMAFATGVGSEISAPLGQAIAGGLFTSTLISLFLVPVLYFVTEKRQIKNKDKIAKIKERANEIKMEKKAAIADKIELLKKGKEDEKQD